MTIFVNTSFIVHVVLNVSFTTKTGRHDIAEILMEVALNTKIQIQFPFIFVYVVVFSGVNNNI